MLNGRKICPYTIITAAVTLLLVFQYGNHVLAEGKAENQSAPAHADPTASSTPPPPVTVATEKQQTAIQNGKNMMQNESQPQAVATGTAKNETQAEKNGTTENNGTHTDSGSVKTPTHNDGPKSGNNETHTDTRGPKTENNETNGEMNRPKQGGNETETVSNSTKSSNTSQTTGNVTDDPTPTPPPPPPTPLPLTILFVNDLQYDIFPVHPENGSRCDGDAEAEKCVGGLPSLLSLMMNETRTRGAIWLNAGNTLGGDLFRTLKFDAAVRAMRLLNFNATAVGPDVFKYGSEAGRKYLDGLNETVVVSNVQPASQRKSVTFSVGNCNVSVIGYLENTKQDQDIPGVSVKNSTQSVLNEITIVRSQQKNVSNLITVVIGSSSVNEAKALARHQTVDFVFFSGANLSAEEGKSKEKQIYWDSVTKETSNETAFVASLRVNRSAVADRFIVGQILLPITNSCSIANTNFTFHSYNNSTPNKEALELVKSELQRLQSQNKSLTDNTKNLTEERDLCSHSECSLGNLVTDAMVAALNGNSAWNGNATTIGIFPALHFLPNMTMPEGGVTETNIFGLLDQDLYIYSVLLTGRQLKDILENSINSSSNSNSSDFLHISRLLQIEYRKDHDNTSKIASVKTVSASESSMRLITINVNDNATFYNVSVPYTLFKMDSYKKLLSAVNTSFHYVTVVEAVTRYINNTKALSLPVVGSRFITLEPVPVPPSPIVCAYHTGTTVAVTLVVAALVVGLIFGVWRYVFGRYRPRSDSALRMINLD